MRTLAMWVPTLLLAGCAVPLSCGPGEQRAISELVYFGTDRASGPIRTEEWRDFLRSSVTPRFPSGFTTWPATGQWRDASGKIVSEASHVLNVVHPNDAESDRAVRAIADDYKSKFQQEAVLRVRSASCASF